MENKKQTEKAAALDRIVNYETFISRMDTDQLIAILNRLDNVEEVSTALTELSIKDKEKASPFCTKILEENLGDEFLQAVAFNLLYEDAPAKAVEIMNKQVGSAPASLLGAMMDCLSADSLQPRGQSISSEILQSIVHRYLDLNDADKNRILENYEWFQESYESKLL